jgi:PAS domain S-box-containing protein
LSNANTTLAPRGGSPREPASPLLAALNTGGELTRKVLDASQNGIYVHDLREGVHTYINAQYTRLTGYGMEQLAAMDSETFFSLFPAEDRVRLRQHEADLERAKDGELLEIEYRFLRRDGTCIWCLSSDAVLERDPDGSVRSIVGTFLDISDRKQAETRLGLSEAHARRHRDELALIYDSAPLGLCTLDRDLRYVRVNQRLAELNGVAVAEHIGRTVAEVVPGIAQGVEPVLRRVLERGEPAIDVEVRGETRAQPGVPRIWVGSFLPMKDESGRVTAISIVAKEVTEERRILQVLAESEERYRLVADYTYDWEYWVGPDGELRWMSPSCARITGYPTAAFLADPGLLEHITHPDDRPAFREHVATVHQGRESEQIQYRVLHAAGQVRWVEHICQPIHFAPDGRYAGRRVSIRDITERRLADEALRWREREFATLVENSPDIIARFDSSLRHLFVNAAVTRATGRAPSELIGKTNEELGMPPELCRLWSDCLREVFRSGEPRSLEFAFPAADGDRFYSLRAVPERGADGSIETVLCTTRDDTARRKAEARARTLATVVETSSDFIGVASLEGQAIYLNRAGQSLVGLDGELEVSATRIEDYHFPEDLSFVRTTVLPTVMRQGRWHGDFRFRHFKTGEAIDVHWDLVRIDDPDTGRPARLATVTRDIRREKAAEQALREANRRKDEFFTVLGHELRNPMAPIRNAVEVLHLLKHGADPRTDWALQVLDRQTTHLSRLLDDLLDVSRIVRGKLRLEPRPVALREVIQHAVDGVGPLIQERRHRLHLHLPGEGLLVRGDPVRLTQILLNLLLNAAYYTQEGGDIRLTTETEGPEVIVRVEDNGPGIPPDQLADLFRPFYQGERAEGASAGGLGLGLTISRRLAEMHGGRLEATSAWPAPGSEFSLYLPRPALPEPSVRAETGQPGGAARDLRVLVVDDNADVARALALLLEVLGYQVETVSSGAEALEAAQRFRPRVALVDIGLPDIDGLTLARRLRVERPDRGQLFLVAVTGYGHEEARQRSLEAGFDEHLPKPVDRRTLQAVLDRVAGPDKEPGPD